MISVSQTNGFTGLRFEKGQHGDQIEVRDNDGFATLATYYRMFIEQQDVRKKTEPWEKQKTEKLDLKEYGENLDLLRALLNRLKDSYVKVKEDQENMNMLVFKDRNEKRIARVTRLIDALNDKSKVTWADINEIGEHITDPEFNHAYDLITFNSKNRQTAREHTAFQSDQTGTNLAFKYTYYLLSPQLVTYRCTLPKITGDFADLHDFLKTNSHSPAPGGVPLPGESTAARTQSDT